MANDKKNKGKAGKKEGKGEKSDRSNPSACPRCGIVVGRSDSLNLHRAETCKKDFVVGERNRKAARYMKKVNADEPECPICHLTTEHKSSIKKHILRKHIPGGGGRGNGKGEGRGTEDNEEEEEKSDPDDELSDDSLLWEPREPKDPGNRKDDNDDDGGFGGTGGAQPIEAC